MTSNTQNEEILKDQEEVSEEAAEAAQAETPQEETPETQAGEESAEKEAAPEKTAEDEALELKYLRLMADFQNFKRRTEAEKADVYAYANEKIALQLLDVIDNFERAMQAGSEDEKFAQGMEMILKQLKGVLDKNNITEIEAQDKEFDPNFHSAVMTQAVEGKESGIVTMVLQKGYMLNNKVIRPAMVAVAE